MKDFKVHPSSARLNVCLCGSTEEELLEFCKKHNASKLINLVKHEINMNLTLDSSDK